MPHNDRYMQARAQAMRKLAAQSQAEPEEPGLGSKLVGAAGTIGGTALGTAIGGPAGGVVGGMLGGKLAGAVTGNTDRSAPPPIDPDRMAPQYGGDMSPEEEEEEALRKARPRGY